MKNKLNFFDLKSFKCQLLAFFLCFTSLWAQDSANPSAAAPSSEPDPVVEEIPNLDKLEEALSRIEASRKQGMGGTVRQLRQQLSSYLSNPAALLDAYKNAYVAVNFDGLRKENAQVKAWEEQNKLLFKDDSFTWALQAHVKYLIATLTKKLGEDDAALKLTMEWIDSMPIVPEKYVGVAKYDLLTGGVAHSIFLRAHNQTTLIHGIENWYTGNLLLVGEMHRVNVIGFLRKKKDPKIFTWWEHNLKIEKESADREGLTSRRQYFNDHRRPWVLWQVAKDYLAFGKKGQALNMMVTALEQSPGCEDFDRIWADIQKILAETKSAKNSAEAKSETGKQK